LTGRPQNKSGSAINTDTVYGSIPSGYRPYETLTGRIYVGRTSLGGMDIIISPSTGEINLLASRVLDGGIASGEIATLDFTYPCR
jgi:hypothetical protein